MEHSKDFETIKRWYDEGFWNTYRVMRAVGKKITEEEYNEITGLVYPNLE